MTHVIYKNIPSYQNEILDFVVEFPWRIYLFRNNRFFKFLASVKLAVVLMTLLIFSLITATILESVYSTEMARTLVYGSPWFSLLLLFLALNLLASALGRYPWKKHQTGFVMAHLGILAILAGSWATRTYGVDARISLAEGSGGSEILDNRPTFYFQEEDQPYQTHPLSFPWFKPSPAHPFIFSPQKGIDVALDRFYPNADRVIRGRPMGPEDGAGLAATHVKLEGSMANKDFWLFLGHPEMDRLMLGPAAVVLQKSSHWSPARLAGLGPNILALLLNDDGSLSFRIRHRGQWGKEKSLLPNRAEDTGWADMRFTLMDFLPRALPETVYEAQPFEPKHPPRPALHYRLTAAEGTREGWLGFDGSSTIRLGGRFFTLAYGEKQLELPFTLKLEKFHVGMNPGTTQPASFESLVKVEPQDGGEVAPVTIKMNNPLKYGGYVFYQASYQPMDNGNYLSVLSVGRDPGVGLKYTGSLILIAGIAFMFWLKKPLMANNSVQA
jgi:hypothetical protein